MTPRPLGYATVAVLRAVADGARYGLDIMERTGLPSGTVYPTLGRLEKRGYVGGRWEEAAVARREGRPRRRYYRLTGAGSVALREAIRRFGALAGGDVGPVARPEEA
ncbi:MAG TPA: helix-turn-helix transcriptional regulator [Longimicrobiales bacterium]|nr:helix-turn-helix transcriptional regulator [Longimicrobiales bacterium]